LHVAQKSYKAILQNIEALYVQGVRTKKLYLSLVIVFILGGCSSQSFQSNVADKSVEVLTDKKYSRNSASCPQIKSACSTGKYEEWEQANGKKGCVCN